MRTMNAGKAAQPLPGMRPTKQVINGVTFEAEPPPGAEDNWKPQQMLIGDVPYIVSQKTGKFEVDPAWRMKNQTGPKDMTAHRVQIEKEINRLTSEYWKPVGFDAAKQPIPRSAKERDDIMARIQQMGAMKASLAALKEGAPAEAAKPAANEVIRVTGDGRKAVFDAGTKEFLLYAD